MLGTRHNHKKFIWSKMIQNWIIPVAIPARKCAMDLDKGSEGNQDWNKTGKKCVYGGVCGEQTAYLIVVEPD